MKRILPPLFSLALAVLAFQSASALENNEWKYQQRVTVSVPGMTRLELPVETLGKSRPHLEDLRLLSPLGIETPFAIEREKWVPVRVETVKSFQLRLGDQSTVMEMETGTAHPITGLVLDSPAPAFVKAALVEGTNDSQNWTPLASSAMIFRQANGVGNLRIPLTPGRWSKLRVTLSDQRSPQVPFTGARLDLATEQPRMVMKTCVPSGGMLLPRETRLDIELGASHLQVARLNLAVADAVFSRKVRVSYFQEDNGFTQEVTVASGEIYHVVAGDQSAASLEIPIEASIPSSQLVLTIVNGDSPALRVKSVDVTWLPVSLVFSARDAGAWTLLTGHPTVAPPAYDMQALQERLGKVEAATAELGPLTAKRDFKEAPVLPKIIPAGASLDLNPWHFRKLLTDAKAAIVQVELDAEALAHSQISLGDLRVIQDGKQIPFLTEASSAIRIVQPAVMNDPDPKHPSVSRWRITMPLVGLPARRVVFSSTTPLFDRAFEIWSVGEDRTGGEYRMRLGSGRWTRSVGDAAAEFQIPLASTRLGEKFVIETENGDNPPIAVEKVSVEYPAVLVVAKISQPGPIFLYYGNEDADTPHYDLQLAKKEIMAAPMVKATLGPEETLRAGPARTRAAELSAGSPWLWAALALVLVVLLWVVAKMLPAASPPQE